MVTVVLQMLNRVFTNNVEEHSARRLSGRELALRGRSGYFGLLVAVWGMVIAAAAFTPPPLKEPAEGDRRG